MGAQFSRGNAVITNDNNRPLELLRTWVYVHKPPNIQKLVLKEMDLGRNEYLFSGSYPVFLQSLPLVTGLNKCIFIYTFLTYIC